MPRRRKEIHNTKPKTKAITIQSFKPELFHGAWAIRTRLRLAGCAILVAMEDRTSNNKANSVVVLWYSFS